MKLAAFTICATNYIGLAKVLQESLRKYNPEIDFFIFVADEHKEIMPESVLFAKDVLNINLEKWYEMAFKYDLTEFCTSIKPKCFEYVFSEEYDKAIYFDPDIFIFNSVSVIYDTLDYHSIILTPHITQIETFYTGNLEENKLLYSGAYNLGFLALKNNEISNSLLEWWNKRLEEYCFQTITENLFTDQKWIDLIPSYFGEEVKIERNMGLNMAPWNFHERKLLIENNQYKVVNRNNNINRKYDLIFVHFSGYNYKALLNREVVQNNISSMNEYPDLNLIFEDYSLALTNSKINEYIDFTYTYNSFNTGEIIPVFLRRLYRRLVETSSFNENPFISEGYLYKISKERKFITNGGFYLQTLKTIDPKHANKKITYINKLFTFAYKVLGFSKYITLLKIMRVYSIWENHYFLVNKSNNDFKIRYF